MFSEKKYILAFISCVRAFYHWFHCAHHVTNGVGFNGDHELYSEIYEDYLNVLDGIIEKSIGCCGVEYSASVLPSLKIAIDVLESLPKPETMTSLAISSAALQIEKDYQSLVYDLFTQLERSGDLTLGLNDFLSASSNKHDTFVYKLTQRVKSEIED